MHQDQEWFTSVMKKEFNIQKSVTILITSIVQGKKKSINGQNVFYDIQHPFLRKTCSELE